MVARKLRNAISCVHPLGCWRPERTDGRRSPGQAGRPISMPAAAAASEVGRQVNFLPRRPRRTRDATHHAGRCTGTGETGSDTDTISPAIAQQAHLNFCTQQPAGAESKWWLPLTCSIQFLVSTSPDLVLNSTHRLLLLLLLFISVRRPAPSATCSACSSSSAVARWPRHL